MAIQLILFIQVLMYSVLVSQHFFYLLAMSGVLKKMQAHVYIETRNLLTVQLDRPLRWVYYLALVSSLVTVSAAINISHPLLFINSLIALLALVADIILAVKKNIPINTEIDQWKAGSYPGNWSYYRAKWFRVFHVRQGISITGFLAVVSAIIFRH